MENDFIREYFLERRKTISDNTASILSSIG